jgi:phosphodiesterase/alkaline phosphatase D-like protein
MVLWTRLHVKGVFGASLGPDPLTVRWELAHDDQLTRVVQSGLFTARPIALSQKCERRCGVLRHQNHLALGREHQNGTAPGGQPAFVFADAQRKGYGVVEFRRCQLSTTLRVVDDVTRLNTKIETLARFTVQAGRPVVERL